MGHRLGTLIGLLLFVAALAAVPPGASAAVEVGDECAASGVASDFTLLPLEGAPGSALPLGAPSAGVLTSWRVDSGLSSIEVENLRAFRPTGNPNEFTAFAASRPEAVLPGLNVFQTRIPVEAGDRFGAFGASPSGALFCSPASAGDSMGAVHFDAGVGSTATYTPNPGFAVALSARIEPDADGDGYGDETQDGCPQSAAYQGSCPRVALRVSSRALRRSILVRVRVSSRAPVRVFGQVSWGVRQPRAATAARIVGLTVGLSGGHRTVSPGGAATFRVPLPRSVRRRLGRLTPAQALTARMTVLATDLAGRLTDRHFAVKLAGRRRP